MASNVLLALGGVGVVLSILVGSLLPARPHPLFFPSLVLTFLLLGFGWYCRYVPRMRTPIDEDKGLLHE